MAIAIARNFEGSTCALDDGVDIVLRGRYRGEEEERSEVNP